MTAADKNKFVSDLEKSGFLAEPGLPEAFLQSLITKPFVILTGNSGTGKTKIAELLAGWLRGNDSGGHELVAVGPDWTDNRNVLGFVNYLRHSGDEKTPVYQSTHLLNLLMRARATRSKPFFLILDEMNLSHVERYFSDFLSAMESKAKELDLHSEGGEAERLPLEPGGQAVVPRKLSIPSNVFVIGTVNVDETTYMFSPKVLDRANVIEFRMPEGSVGSFLSKRKNGSLDIAYAGDGVAERFLSFSEQARSGQLPDPNNGSSATDFSTALNGVFAVMRDARLEFGFRTINEIRRYVRVDHALTQEKPKWDWTTVFDYQLLQKILPKLSGSRRRLEDLLVRLAVFCESGKVPASSGNIPSHLQAIPVKRVDRAIFTKSYRKLCDMLDAVRRDQFVSFIH
jgi:5-methylcytosine-specific restriction protein B